MSFTARERQIWRALAAGGTAKEVASQMNLSFHTVNTVNRTLHRRLKVRNAPELTLAAIAHGVMAPPPRIPIPQRSRIFKI